MKKVNSQNKKESGYLKGGWLRVLDLVLGGAGDRKEI